MLVRVTTTATTTSVTTGAATATTQLTIDETLRTQDLDKKFLFQSLKLFFVVNALKLYSAPVLWM
jgi:hypothetical protein